MFVFQFEVNVSHLNRYTLEKGKSYSLELRVENNWHNGVSLYYIDVRGAKSSWFCCIPEIMNQLATLRLQAVGFYNEDDTAHRKQP